MSGKSGRPVPASAVRTDLAILQWFGSKQRIRREGPTSWFDSPPPKRQKIRTEKKHRCFAITKNGVQCDNLCTRITTNYCHTHQQVEWRDESSRCITQTKKGVQCKNLCTASYCHVHRAKFVRPCVRRESRDERKRCIVNTTKGVQCKILCTTNYCHVHRAQVVRQLGWRNVCHMAGVAPVLSSVDELYDSLLEANSLENQASTTIRLIAEFGVGVLQNKKARRLLLGKKMANHC